MFWIFFILGWVVAAGFVVRFVQVSTSDEYPSPPARDTVDVDVKDK